MLKRTWLLFLSMSACAFAQTFIYSETFSGSGSTNLVGTVPTTRPGSETWSGTTGASSWMANGAVNSTGDANAFLPFNPTSGFIYTLSLDANPAGGTGSWLALGFTAGNSATRFQLSPTDPSPWLLLRDTRGNGQGQTFFGPGTNGGANYNAPSGVVNLQLVLNTTGSQWTAGWFINGVSVRSETYVTNPTINYVGFGKIDNVSGTIDNFSLTQIPEPSTYAMIAGIGALGLVWYRRKRA